MGRADVHGGGYQAADRFVFELCGGRLCLDFVNTLDERLGEEPKERLRDYKDLVDWAEQAGLLGRRERRELVDQGRHSPRRAEAVLGRARRIRETLYEIFSKVADGRPPGGSELQALEAELPEAYAAPTLARVSDGFELVFRSDPKALHGVLHPVVRSAAELLASEEIARVRMCASQTCAWLYLDETRNQSRKWCDMAVCGNREKARRFYRRQKSKE